MEEFNNTEAPYPQEETIHELFAQQVERVPDHTALLGSKEEARKAGRVEDNAFGGMHLTYKELNKKSNQLARLLREKGVQPDTIVGLMVERSIEMIIGLLGILKSGGAYLPIDREYPLARIKYILADSRARVLVSGENEATAANKTLSVNLSEVSKVGEGIELILPDNTMDYFTTLPSHPSQQTTTTPPTHHIQQPKRTSPTHPTHLCYVIYTSGSTGKPKGVMVQHRSVVNRLKWMQKGYPLKEDDVILQKTPFTFDVSVWELFWWSIQGASLCLLAPGEEKNPAAIVEAIERNNVTTMHFVPSMLNAFLEYLEYQVDLNKLASLKQVFSSGEALLIHHVQKFNNLLNRANGTRLINLYGPTEATVDVSYFNCLPRESIEKIPIGKPIDNIRLLVVDRNLHLQPLGVVGELCISGVGLARGYLNNQELTSEKFINYKQDGLHASLQPGSHAALPYHSHSPHLPYSIIYRTGDLTRWLPDGNIEFIERIDNQVKIRGYRIELGEIESRLLSHDSIKEALVLTTRNKDGDKALCAWIVPDKEFEISALKNYLAAHLPGYMIPSHFFRVKAIPLKSNGKIDKKKLLEQREDAFQSSATYVEPKTHQEMIIADTWKEILQVDKVGLNDNFFDLGGHSIDIIKVNVRLKKAFNRDIPIVKMFRYPTVGSLSTYLSPQESTEEDQFSRRGQDIHRAIDKSKTRRKDRIKKRKY